jgi:hypothetical protein
MQSTQQLAVDDRLKVILDADEQVLWQGKPDAKSNNLQTALGGVIGTLGLVTVSYGINTALTPLPYPFVSYNPEPDYLILALKIVTIVVVALMLVWLLLYEHFKRARVVYAVTSKRLLTLPYFGNGNYREKSLDSPLDINVQHNMIGGSRDVRIIYFGAYSLFSEGFCFQNILDADNVIRIIRQAREEAMARLHNCTTGNA